ncbi:MAG: hypothetical protein L6Q78_02910 [Bacteroidia bacterium]|nr:hypothetical protein [Bacteroidia bacterium]
MMGEPSKLEKFLNYLVGVVLITNLYLLTGLFRVPYLFILMLCLGVSSYYLVRRFNPERFFITTISWISVFYFSLSIVFFVIEWLVHGASPKINDLVRVLIYLIYFSWTFFMFPDFESARKFLYKLVLIAAGVLIVQGILESSQPILFALLLSENVSKNLNRVGGTLIDANTFANTLLILLVLAWLFRPPKSSIFQNVMGIVFWVFALYLLELSGSRQGLVIALLYGAYRIYLRMKFEFWKIYLVIAGVFVLGIIASMPMMMEYFRENPNSSVARLFFAKENSKSSNSDHERKNSLDAGFRFIENNGYVLGPGSLAFDDSWGDFTQWGIHVPHNCFVFLWGQYGIATLLFAWFLWISFRRSYFSGSWIVFVLFFVQFNLQPNSIYYSLQPLCLIAIDLVWYFRVNQPTFKLALDENATH